MRWEVTNQQGEEEVINQQGEEEARLELPPGFQFYSSEEELVPKVPYFSCVFIPDEDLNKTDPWELPSMFMTGMRTNRATASGCWKAMEKSIPPGFRFCPNDEELISHYLSTKLLDSRVSRVHIVDVDLDLNKTEPWDLPGNAKMGEEEWYFFNFKDRKYPTGTRTNRPTASGYWKAKDRKALIAQETALLFAYHPNGFPEGTFSCPKSLVLNNKVERQTSSALPTMYEGGWLPALHQHGSPKIQINPMQVVNRNSPSLPEVANINVYSTQRESVDRVLSVKAQEESLHQHLIQTAEGSHKPRSNSAPAINSTDETAHIIPAAPKLTNEESEHHSNPNPCVDERGNTEKKKRTTIWLVAAGALNHMTGDRGLFTNLEDENSDLCVQAADGTPMPVCGRGNVTGTVTLHDVWYVPGLDVNLVSVGQLAELDYSIEFARGSCTICDAADRVIGRACAREDGMYELEYLDVSLLQ